MQADSHKHNHTLSNTQQYLQACTTPSPAITLKTFIQGRQVHIQGIYHLHLIALRVCTILSQEDTQKPSLATLQSRLLILLREVMCHHLLACIAKPMRCLSLVHTQVDSQAYMQDTQEHIHLYTPMRLLRCIQQLIRARMVVIRLRIQEAIKEATQAPVWQTLHRIIQSLYTQELMLCNK